MRLLVIAAAAGVLAVAAQAAAQSGGGPAGPSPAAGTPATPSTAGYLQQAGQSDLYEIQASQLELARGQDPRAKAFAQRMVQDHTQSTDMLLAAARRAHLPATPPASLDPQHQALIDQLRAASSPGFDTLYLHQQVAAHDQALQLHQNFAQNGGDAALQPVAAQIAGVVQQHRAMLSQLGAS